jgi:methionyl-tRNA synthetase
MAGKSFYLTTTLPYVNADPHIGFALELVHADVAARYKRLLGREVFFNTGTDEHGQKIFQKAQEEGRDVGEYVDHYAARFEELKQALNLNYDAFIRTTEPKHIGAAQELWRRCDAAGDIYKKKYKGLYCVGDEAFIKESDLVDGKCPNHPTMTPIEIEEENYFFKLSNYQRKLEEYLAREGVIVPEWRRQEALNFVKGGLEDFSISRIQDKMPWGIPVPGDDTQVMYVWFDALTNYISTLGWPGGENFKKFWDGGQVVQMAGKDQVRFQSVMWQAMLMSANIKNTDKVVYHGFITSGGQKMSKSLGNVIEPFGLANEYGTDAVRYLLARIHPFEDSDVTLEKLKETYNADLANGLGNLAARVMKMAEDNLDKPVKVDNHGYRFEGGYIDEQMQDFRLDMAVTYIWTKIADLDREIAEKKPFSLFKENPEEAKEIIRNMVLDLYRIGYMLKPFMPKTAEAIIEATRNNRKPENLFPRKD